MKLQDRRRSWKSIQWLAASDFSHNPGAARGEIPGIIEQTRSQRPQAAPQPDPAAIEPRKRSMNGLDAFLLTNPNYSFFHSSSWAEVLSASYKYTPYYLAESNQDRLVALFPLMEVDSFLTGRRGISLPFTDECQPLVTDASFYPAMLQKIIQHGASRRWNYLECRGGRNLCENVPASLSFYGHTLRMSGDEKHLFAGFKSETRTALRKAERAGIQLEISQGMEAVRAFYGLHCMTRKRHGLPPQPFRFFENIYRCILKRDLGFVVTGWLGPKPIAAALFVHLGKKVIYKFAASDRAFQRLRVSNLVIWHAIKWCVRNGFEALSFGRTSLGNDGLRRFKLGWGTEETRIDYFKYDFRTSAFVTEKDPTAAWPTKLFRMMPVRFSRLIGALLYRHIS